MVDPNEDEVVSNEQRFIVEKAGTLRSCTAFPSSVNWENAMRSDASGEREVAS
jgi:hypothetical protein